MNTKLIYLARRNPALSEAEFPVQWKAHSTLSAGFTHLRDLFISVAQCSNLRRPDIEPRAALTYDGVNLLALRAVDAPAARLAAMWRDPDVVAVLQPDELRVFSGLVQTFSMIAEEHPQRDGPMQPICLVNFLKRRAGLTPAEFLHAWSTRHAPAVLALATGPVRYAINPIVAPPPPGYDFDGVEELWFASLADVAATCANARWIALMDQGRSAFCDVGACVTMLTHVTHARPPLPAAMPIRSGAQTGNAAMPAALSAPLS